MSEHKKNSVESLFEDSLVESGEVDGHRYYVTKSPCFQYGMSGYNGYVAFPTRPTVEQGYDGILTYVPVHGGITFADQFDEGMVYGFDTGHCDSDKVPRTDVEWVKKQIRLMIAGIKEAAKVEKQYLTSKRNETHGRNTLSGFSM